MILVVDASLWVLRIDDEDPRCEQARDVLGKAASRNMLLAPHLIAHELLQFIHVNNRQANETLEVRQKRAQQLIGDLELASSDSSNQGQAAERFGLTAYDAAYLELAQRLVAGLVTEDAELHKAGVKALGAKRSLRLADLAKLVA